MQLLPKDHLIRTSDVDHADWNYTPVLSYVMRKRFQLVRELLPAARVDRLLEIGFGSGVFMPELASRCRELYGIDVHPNVEEVEKRLTGDGVKAALSQQDAAHIDFPDRFFDVIVSVSALEFIEDIDNAARHAARVLKSGGRLIGVTPVKSRLLDAILHAATGADPVKDYGDRRERVLPSLLRYFKTVRTRRFIPAYIAYELEPVT